MRIKTFLATYILFLVLLFSISVIVSTYMTNSQTSMLRDKSIREYQTISANLANDINRLYSRSAGAFDVHFQQATDTLMRGYQRYYGQFGIRVSLTETFFDGTESDGVSSNQYKQLSFIQENQRHFIHITGALPEPLNFLNLNYYLDITDNITDMQSIQHVLLIFAIIFSIIAAVALYVILRRIFGPLSIVASTSQKIANGQYDERIEIKGKNEIASMAFYFNRMAERIGEQIKQLEDEAASKQQFIDNFAHEIRTPLTSIYGYAEYIQKAPLDEDGVIDSTQAIINESNHMKNIADSLLKLATLRNLELTRTAISIPSMFENIEQTLKQSLTDKGAKLIYKSEVETLDGQEDLIKSLLLNLCSNAIKSCPDGKGVVYLGAKQEGDKMILSVTDNGCGISKEEIEKITEPFYRVDKARSKEHGGAGLGLALCKQIAEVHGAEMTIESEVGVGTSIKILFTIP